MKRNDIYKNGDSDLRESDMVVVIYEHVVD